MIRTPTVNFEASTTDSMNIIIVTYGSVCVDTLYFHLRWEEPEEHCAVVSFID